MSKRDVRLYLEDILESYSATLELEQLKQIVSEILSEL